MLPLITVSLQVRVLQGPPVISEGGRLSPSAARAGGTETAGRLCQLL